MSSAFSPGLKLIVVPPSTRLISFPLSCLWAKCIHRGGWDDGGFWGSQSFQADFWANELGLSVQSPCWACGLFVPVSITPPGQLHHCFSVGSQHQQSTAVDSRLRFGQDCPWLGLNTPKGETGDGRMKRNKWLFVWPCSKLSPTVFRHLEKHSVFRISSGCVFPGNKGRWRPFPKFRLDFVRRPGHLM